MEDRAKRSNVRVESAKAFHRDVEEYQKETGDTLEEIAEGPLGGWVSHQYVSEMACNHRPLRADVVVRFTRETGRTHAIEALCRLCGGTFRRDPEKQAVELNLAASMREFSEWLSRASSALADGRITKDELPGIRAEFGEMVTAVHGAEEAIERQAGGGSDGRASSLAGAEAYTKAGRV